MKMVAWERIVRNVSSVKNLIMMGNPGINARVMVFEHMLKLVGEYFWMMTFCDLYSRRKNAELKYS
jgi:hypothetical protein